MLEIIKRTILRQRQLSTITTDKMVVRIRLARFGNKHNPFFNIVVSQARYVVPSANEYLDFWKHPGNTRNPFP
jgi:hypothetical protein